MNRKLSVGETLNEVFSIYGAKAGVLLPVAFWLFLVVAILNGLAEDSAVLLLIALIASLLAGTLYQGIVVNLVREVEERRPDPSMGDMINSVMPVLAPLLGAGLLAALGIGLGLIALIVPGLIALTFWAVIAPAIVIEKRGVFAAFGRSNELVKGNGWAVFGVVFTALVISLVGAVIFGGIAEAIAGGPLLRIVFSALASTITAPIAALAAAVLYYRLLAIHGPPPADPASTPDPAPPLDPPPAAPQG
jgi:hypothetical protein